MAPVLGLLAAAQSPVAGTAEASVRALDKVIQVMPERLRRRVDALRATTELATWGPPAASVDADTLIAVAQACRDSQRLDFDYAAADQVCSQRCVEPHRLVSLGWNWYLVAHDLTRHDWRSFRLNSAGRSSNDRDALRTPRPASRRRRLRTGRNHPGPAAGPRGRRDRCAPRRGYAAASADGPTSTSAPTAPAGFSSAPSRWTGRPSPSGRPAQTSPSKCHPSSSSTYAAGRTVSPAPPKSGTLVPSIPQRKAWVVPLTGQPFRRCRSLRVCSSVSAAAPGRCSVRPGGGPAAGTWLQRHRAPTAGSVM